MSVWARQTYSQRVRQGSAWNRQSAEVVRASITFIVDYRHHTHWEKFADCSFDVTKHLQPRAAFDIASAVSSHTISEVSQATFVWPSFSALQGNRSRDASSLVHPVRWTAAHLCPRVSAHSLGGRRTLVCVVKRSLCRLKFH